MGVIVMQERCIDVVCLLVSTLIARISLEESKFEHCLTYMTDYCLLERTDTRFFPFLSLTGTEQQLSATNLLVDTTSSTVVTDTFHNEGDIMISTASLNNGDR